jgi:RimJ/RimL family protein N-acetyltransferase
MPIELCRRIDDASLRAWPALEQLVDDGGWVLRFAGGFTKRANSVTAVEPPPDLREAVERCERHYAERGAPAVFRLLSFAQPPGLDPLLADRGYEKMDESLVMSRPLPDDLTSDAHLVRDAPLDPWLDLFETFSAGKPARRPVHRGMLEAIHGPRLLAVTPGDGPPAGCGLGVVDRELFGLFDLVIAPSQRRKGHGRHLTRGMLAWGRAQGAERAYLQVIAANAPARLLYEQLGFSETYRYWYRRAPGVGRP